MTEDRPSGAELLETAADSLREEVLPGVPTEHRLTLLMVLNAMGIAEREIRDRLGAAGRGEGPDEAAGALVERIRAGHFDEGSEAAALHAGLSAEIRRRLAIANPKYLRQAEEEG